jgi:uncharacterized membrane protein
MLIYIVVTIILLIPAIIYQGYCDARGVKNKLSTLIGLDEDMIMIIAMFWPVVILIMVIGLIILCICIPFFCVYYFSVWLFDNRKKK